VSKRIQRFVRRRQKQFVCQKCGERLATLTDYRNHYITEHQAVLVPVTQEDLMIIQQFLSSPEGLKAPRELYDFFMVGKLISSNIGV